MLKQVSHRGASQMDRVARGPVAGYLRRCAVTIGGFIALLWLIQLLDTLVFQGGLVAFGVVPRTVRGLRGILFQPLIHAGFGHVLSNSIGIALFGSMVYLKSERDFWLVTLAGTLGGGLGVWLFGRTAIHVGASGVVFAYFGYLISAGLFERRVIPVLVSLVLLVFWGSLLLGLSPLQHGVSWEGHLFGLASGVVAAGLLVRRAKAR
jgi:membrane associated rhomboid family serine protease